MSMRETCLFLAGTFQWAGFHQHPIVVQKECRAASSSYTLRRRLALLLNAVTSFSAYPLHIIFFIGVALTVFSMAAGGGMIIYRIVKGDALQVGWASIMVSVWFLGGMTIAMVGVIGLYLSKVFEEVKARPRFLVKQTIDVSSQANKTT
jgi:putative glycosyltransferase